MSPKRRAGMVDVTFVRRWTKTERAGLRMPLVLGVLVASSLVILGSPSIPHAVAAQPVPSSKYFGNAYNSTQSSVGTVALTNATQLIDARFTARVGGEATPRLSIYLDYFKANASYDVLIGIQTDAAGNPSGHFLGAFVWNVTSGFCNGCGGWVYPGFARQSYNLNHTITLFAGTVYHLVVEYFNGSLVNNGGCYGTDCLAIRYIGGTNFQQESLDMHYDPNQALLACGNVDSCGVVPGANAVYALDINGSAWRQGQTESFVLDRPIGAPTGGGLGGFQGERFWMAWNSITVDQIQVLLSKVGAPVGSLNLLVWNFTAPSAADILKTTNAKLMLNQSLIPDLVPMLSLTDKSYNFSLSRDLTLEYGHMYQISFAIYGNTSAIDSTNGVAVEVTNSNHTPNQLNWAGGDGSAGSPCPQLALGCAGFSYAGSTDNSVSEESGAEDLVFIMKIASAAVTAPLSVELSGSPQALPVSVVGCHASPPTFPSDGSPHLENLDPSCQFSLAFDNNATVRAGFQVAGNFSAVSAVQTSCPAGVCSGLSFTAFEQVANTFRATPTMPSLWDASLGIRVTGTQLGVQGQEGCVIQTSAGGGRAVCQAWFDYGSIATILSPVPVTSSERWIAPGQNTFMQKAGGNNYTAAYVDQFNVTFAVTPPGSGTIEPSNSSLWENYGTISVNGTPASGFGFVSWSTNATGIAIATEDNASTTAVVQGSGTITATFVAFVSQPITLSIAEEGARPANFSLSGCSVSPTFIVGNDSSLVVTAIPSCNILVTAPRESQGLRYSFESGGLPSPTISIKTCSQGACPSSTSSYHEQVSESFAFTILGGGSSSYPTLDFISLGASSNQTEATTPTTLWLDFGTNWSVSDLLPGSSQDERWIASSGNNGTALASGSELTDYQHQYSIAMAVSPASCGATIPSGSSWQPAGVVFSIEASATTRCVFSSWIATPGITVAQPANLNTTVTSQGAGTITASFSEPLVSSSTTNSPVFLVGIAVGLTLVVVCIAIIAQGEASRRLDKRP